MRGVVFVDLDSTLANTSHRHHLVEEAREAGIEMDWDAYADACELDVPFPGVVATVRLLSPYNTIVILSHRPQRVMQQSVAWLYDHAIPFNEMLLREDGHPDTMWDFKVRAISRYLEKNGLDQPALIIEDQPLVKDAFEAEGWPVLLVNPDYYREEQVHG